MSARAEEELIQLHSAISEALKAVPTVMRVGTDYDRNRVFVIAQEWQPEFVDLLKATREGSLAIEIDPSARPATSA